MSIEPPNTPADECANELADLSSQLRYAKNAPLPKKMAAAERALDMAMLVLYRLHDRLRVLESRLKE